MLEIRQLHAGYGSVEILRGIDLDVGQGEIVAVLGSNGVGKSTLNNNISALYRPFAGSIRFQGQELVGLSSSEIVRRGVIHVPEGRRVFPNLNVLENLELGSLVRGKANRSRNLEKVVGIFPRLKERIKQTAGTLSGGEQQRLALARAWALGPDVLFLDEPTANLDPASAHDIENIVNTIHASGTKIIMTTHNLGQARRLGDEILFISNGRLMEHTPIDRFFKEPASAEATAFIKGELPWH